VSPGGCVTKVRVTRMRRADAASVAQVANTLFDQSADVAALRRYLSDSRNIFLLAFTRGKAVGFLRGTALEQIHSKRPQMLLYEVGVARRFRRRGVGKLLVQHLLDHCRSHHFEEAFVFTDPSNRAAVRLYRSTGAVTETPRDRMFVYRFERRARLRQARLVHQG
jgi:ribosomal protein S18 acetylase RimI-like enzyme